MKILGHSGLKPRTKEIPVGVSADDGKEIKVKLTAPPLRFIDRAKAELGSPDLPTLPKAPASGEVARGPRGEILKDDLGRPVVALNESDPAYLAALKGEVCVGG